MEVTDYGLRDPEVLRSASIHIDVMLRNFAKGYGCTAGLAFADMKAMLDVFVQEDILIGQNPALTEWRLDQFNDWFELEVRAKRGDQKPHLPRLVLDVQGAKARVTHEWPLSGT